MMILLANRWLPSVPPLWLVGMAALVALLVAGLVQAVLMAVRPRAAAEMQASLRDGFLGPFGWLLLTYAVAAVALTPLVPVGQVWRSLVRMTGASEASLDVEIPGDGRQVDIPLDLRPQELESLELVSTANILVRTQQPIAGYALEKVPDVDLTAGAPWDWQRKEGATNPFLSQQPTLEATNDSGAPARLAVRWRLTPEYPQAAILPWAIVALTGLLGLYAVFRLGFPRVAAVASATTKEAIGQPVFLVALLVGAVLLVSFIVIPYNTFGEDVKMLKDSSLTLIKVLALLVVVWTASISVADEIEGRTAVTVLSKPLRRWQFIIGKFAGLVLVALLVFLILGGVLLATTSLKVVYDAREGSKLDPGWRDCAEEMITVVPGLVLSLFETILMAAVSLAVSTRLGMVPNLIVCFAIYTVGHLVPLIVQSSVGRFAIVRFVGQFFATILPVLDHFTIEAAVIGGVAVPWSYLAWAGLYAALYSAVALLVALVLFQDRDLA